MAQERISIQHMAHHMGSSVKIAASIKVNHGKMRMVITGAQKAVVNK